MASGKDSGKRLGAFDFVKGIAIVLVVITHARIFGGLPWQLLDIVPVAVPLFFVASGYLLYLRHPEGYGIGHLKSVFWRLIAIYVIFSLAAEALSDPARLAMPLAVIYDIIVGAGGSGLYYFVPALVQLYIAYPLLARLFANRKARVPVLVLALALSLIFDSVNSSVQVPAWNSNLPMLAFAGRYLFYFVAGMFICSLGLDFESKDAKTNPEAWKKQIAGLAVALAAYLACIAGYASAYSQVSEIAFFISAAFAFISLAYSCAFLQGAPITMELAGIAELLGKNSLVIYLTHGFVIYLVLLPVIGWGARQGMLYLASAATLIISLGISLAFNYAYKRVQPA